MALTSRIAVGVHRLSSNADRLYRSIIPVVKLGPEFKLVRDYHMRIPYIPDMRDLDHLTVSGDVRFGEGVVLKVRAPESVRHSLEAPADRPVLHVSALCIWAVCACCGVVLRRAPSSLWPVKGRA